MQFFAITFLSLCLAAISTSAAPAPVSNFTPDASTLTQHSKRIGLPHEICMDTLGKASHRLAVDVYPTFKTQVCDRGLQPSADDFAVFEKQFIIPTYSKLGKLGVKLPPYKPQIKKLVESIVNQCAKKQKTNFCKQADLDKVKGCAVDKAMGFIMGHMDLADKYGNEANCKVLDKALNDNAIWKSTIATVNKIAKTIT